MKFLSVLRLAVGLSLPIVGALCGPAVAQTCPAACGLQKKACLMGPRAKMAACKLGCRMNAEAGDLGACLHGCAGDFRFDRGTCRGGAAECVATCRSSESPAASNASPSCLGSCGQDLGECARAVAMKARGCIRDCRSASDRRACLELCGDTAHGDAQNCASVFASCRTDCGVPPPVPSCGRAEAPTCDGACPLPTLTCVPVSSSRCGCMPASPNGGFVD